MLHLQAIHPPTLELLIKLLAVKEFEVLRLVGGTSLALQLGHRISVDIDLFGNLTLSDQELSYILSKIGTVEKLGSTANISVYLVNGIKVDIVNYTYPWIDELVYSDKIPLAGLKDIAAMKLSAITGRGSKKDFTDLFFLLEKFSLDEMMEFYFKKYSDGTKFLVLKSLSYFADADREPDLNMLSQISWPEIKAHLKLSIEQYLNKQ
jgi:hypothetical protein